MTDEIPKCGKGHAPWLCTLKELHDGPCSSDGDAEELASSIMNAIVNVGVPPELASSPPWKWFWIYSVPPRERTDEIHLFPADLVPADMRGKPVFPVPDGKWPRCCREKQLVLPKDMAHRMVLNVGAGDVLRIATAAGNTTIICADCQRMELDEAVLGALK